MEAFRKDDREAGPPEDALDDVEEVDLGQIAGPPRL
jgi:hypothetical protein